MACPLACPRGKLRSLPAPGPPSPKPRRGGSADLMNFYATTSMVAHGQPWNGTNPDPLLGHHPPAGYVPNNHSAISCLLCPRSTSEGHLRDVTTSTTTEHFRPLWLPDGRSLLPHHVHQPGSGYLQECPRSCLQAGVLRPQDKGLPQGSPRAPREHSPAQPDVLQKTTIGAKDPSGFTRNTPRGNSVLPARPGHPLGVSITTTHYVPSAHSHGAELLPTLPLGSERGSGFSREVPSSLGTAGLPPVGHPVLLVSRGLRAPRESQARLLGQQRVGRKEPSGFTINHGPYVTPCPAPAAPARCGRDPTWTARPPGGIQPQRPSGFGTNNHPTGLGRTSATPPRPGPPQAAAPHFAWGSRPLQ